MNWHEIKSQSDADHLMERFGSFHDGCIREVHIWTDTWVNPDLSMSISPGLDVSMRLHIQRQYRNPMAIELFFEKVTRFNLVPTPENCDSIIIAATMIVRDGLIYWAPLGNWDHTIANCDNDTWVSGKKLRWREVDNWIGKNVHYGFKNEINGK